MKFTTRPAAMRAEKMGQERKQHLFRLQNCMRLFKVYVRTHWATESLQSCCHISTVLAAEILSEKILAMSVTSAQGRGTVNELAFP